MLIETAVGVFGLVILLALFVLNASKRIRRDSFEYNGLNFIAAALLLHYAIAINSLLFIALQVIWLVFAAYFILRKALRRSDIDGWSGDYSGSSPLAKPPKPKRKKPVARKKKDSDSGSGAGTSPVWPWQQ